MPVRKETPRVAESRTEVVLTRYCASRRVMAQW